MPGTIKPPAKPPLCKTSKEVAVPISTTIPLESPMERRAITLQRRSGPTLAGRGYAMGKSKQFFELQFEWVC